MNADGQWPGLLLTLLANCVDMSIPLSVPRETYDTVPNDNDPTAHAAVIGSLGAKRQMH
jgi:hypothetical protein